MSVTPVVFPNRDGLKLFGMFHEPSGPRQSTVILLLSPGVKMRVGPSRLYMRMTEAFLALGFPVLRFDFHGMGDSEGEIAEDSLAAVYNSVHDGRFVGDVLAAMDWLEAERGVSRIVLAGLCGGAVTGLLAGAQDRRVQGLLGLGIPVCFEGGQGDFAKYVTQGQLNRLKRGYLRKLADPKAWLRLLTLKSDFRVIGKILRQGMRNAGRTAHTSAPCADPAALDNLNPKFAPAFLDMLKRRRRMLLIFSGNDRLGWEFEEKFYAPNRQVLEAHRSQLDLHTVAKANHVFTQDAWREEMLAHACTWLRRHFAQAPRARATRAEASVNLAGAACAPALRDG